MLPTDDEPIVPFDRTFGGVVGKRNPLSLVVGSCKTITGDQCYRYLKPLVDVVLWEMIGLFLLFVGFMVEGYFWAPPCWMLSFLARVVPGGAGGE